MRIDTGNYLGIEWRIGYFYTDIVTDFIIPYKLCEELNLTKKYHHTKKCAYFFLNYKDDLNECKEFVYEIIEKIVHSRYEPGGQKFLESKKNIEKLIEK